MRKPKQTFKKQRQPQQRHPDDLSRILVALDSDCTLLAVVELSLSSWLVAGIVPGVERQPLKKLSPQPDKLLQLLHRWRCEAERSGTRSRVSPWPMRQSRRLLAGALAHGA